MTSPSAPRLSIIIPMYNAELYVENFFKNLKELDSKEVEIIIVDDGSKDESLHLTQQYSESLLNVKLIQKSNGGVSSARNAGIKIAKGEWISFADIDDEILPEKLAELMQLPLEDMEVVFAGHIRNGQNCCKRTLYSKSASSKELAKELFKPTDFPYLGFPWAKLFKRAVIIENNLQFKESIKYNEDRLFVLEYLSHIESGYYTTLPIYNYIQREGGAMQSINGPAYWKFETDLDAFIEMNKIVRIFNSKELTNLVRKGTILSYNWNKRLNHEYGNNNKSYRRRIKQKLLSQVTPFFILQQYLQGKYRNLRARLNS